MSNAATEQLSWKTRIAYGLGDTAQMSIPAVRSH